MARAVGAAILKSVDGVTTRHGYGRVFTDPRVLLLVAVAAQSADLLTYSPAHEANPLVHPATALPLKVALLILVLAVAVIGYRRLVLGVGIAAGLLGALTNVVAAGA